MKRVYFQVLAGPGGPVDHLKPQVQCENLKRVRLSEKFKFIGLRKF